MPSKEELTDFLIDFLDRACELLGVDNPLDEEEGE
jgi:hypothetical protein